MNLCDGCYLEKELKGRSCPFPWLCEWRILNEMLENQKKDFPRTIFSENFYRAKLKIHLKSFFEAHRYFDHERPIQYIDILKTIVRREKEAGLGEFLNSLDREESIEITRLHFIYFQRMQILEETLGYVEVDESYENMDQLIDAYDEYTIDDDYIMDQDETEYHPPELNEGESF